MDQSFLTGNTGPNAETAKNRGIELFGVGIGASIDIGEINNIASDPDSEHVVRVDDVNQVEAAADNLLDILCR